MIHEYFPQVAVDIQNEIRNHPLLLKQLAEVGEDAPLEERFSIICLYCGLVLDGYYSNDDLERIMHMVMERLKKLGAVSVVSH